MNIMLVCSFPASRIVGGDSIVANELAKQYIQAGHCVSMVSIHANAIPGEHKSLAGIECIGYNPLYPKIVKLFFRELLDLYNPKACAFLKKLLKRKRPDCIHFHGEHGGISAFAPRVAKKLGIPCILSLHSAWLLCAVYNLGILPTYKTCSGPAAIKCFTCRRHGYPYTIPVPFRERIAKKLALAADYITVPSRFFFDIFIQNGYPASKLKLIQHGVDSVAFHPRASIGTHKKGKPFKVLIVGRVRIKKGFQYLFDACSNLHNSGSNIQLDVVGDLRPESDQYPFVKYHGPVERNKLPQCYQEADVLVQASIIHESFGLTLLEAMACGVPVIATSMGSMPEIVGDGGVIVPPRDVNALANALRNLMDNHSVGMQLSENGRARAEKHFSWQHKSAAYLDLIATAIHARS